MAANQHERHGKARAKLKQIFATPERVSVIHYSCESFYDLPNGRSPRITSIAIRKLDNAQTESFSIHQIAEIRGISLESADIEPSYNEYEKLMLDEFFEFMRNNTEHTFVHWNMRDKNYGFRAIEHRYKVLGGNPIVLPDDRKLDLSRLLIDLYGVAYIGHPRLETLLEKNSVEALDFMTGAQEAEAFTQGKYVDLHRSTLRKVDVFCNLAQRAFDKTLKVNTTWKEAHGLSFRTLLYLAKKHWIYTTLIVAGGAGGALGGIYKGYTALMSALGYN